MEKEKHRSLKFTAVWELREGPVIAEDRADSSSYLHIILVWSQLVFTLVTGLCPDYDCAPYI